MATHYLDKLFNPASIAVIGASDRPNSVGMKVFANLLKANYAGKLYPVNPKHEKVQGQHAFSTIKEIPHAVDLAVITTPAITVPTIIAECGEKGVPAAIIISAGFSEKGAEGKTLEQSFLKLAHEHNIRLVGPNCLGIMRPHIKLNATFDNGIALPGDIAFVSQSGAIVAAVLDWTINKKIGFSTIVSLGNAADLDFGEILDFLALDSETESILLYIEGIHDAKRFMSGLRAAARIKPVIVIKGGRHAQGSRAAHSHTGALVGNDDAFDAALRRGGAVRVMTIEQLFSATEILSSDYRTNGNRLAIITNGGGAGVMAADRVAELNVSLAKLSEDSLAQLNKVLPSEWSHQNPIDVIGDAPPERYHAALDICIKDTNIDGVLTMLVPVAMSNPLKVAEQVIADAKASNKPILACWMGEEQVKSSWELFAKHKLPYFYTPEEAVEAFSYLADYQHNQKLLMQIPEPSTPEAKPDITIARQIIESALAESRTMLTTIESKKILKSFYIPVNQPIEVSNVEDAIKSAKSLGFPVVMKINSPDISHKQDAGGVALNIINEEAVRVTFNKLVSNAKNFMPNANILGVTVEPMFKSANDRELMIGVISDKVFGPIISFGAGGTFVEIMKDRALALPPLNQFIAKHLIAQTQISKILGEFRHMPAVNLDIIINTLLRVSEMICELPEIQEMDINPFTINEKGAMAIDARIVIAPLSASSSPYSRLAIQPDPA